MVHFALWLLFVGTLRTQKLLWENQHFGLNLTYKLKRIDTEKEDEWEGEERLWKDAWGDQRF